MPTFTTSEVAEQLRVGPRKVLKLAKEYRLGINAEGRAGYRFEQADVDAMWEAMRPVQKVARRRKVRSA